MALPRGLAPPRTGRIWNPPLQGFVAAQGLRFPGGPPCWHRPVGRAFTPAAPSKFKTGNVPAAAGCGGMRASRPTAARGRVPFPFGRAFAMVCRGGPWPSRGTLRRHRPRGTISGLRAGPMARLASETRLRAQCKHRPLHGFVITRGPRFARLAAGPSWFVGEGFIPPAEPCPAANRADMESAPTGVCDGAGSAVSRRAAMLAPARRAGVHARRTLEISKIGTLRRRGVRRDEGIPPYGRPGACALPVWPGVRHGL